LSLRARGFWRARQSMLTRSHRLLRRLRAPRNDTFFIIANLFLLTTSIVNAAEPYFITIQKVELKRNSGEWVSILEPDHRVDLRTTKAAVSFFNNGRVPHDQFKNFKIAYEDHGQSREMSRKKDLEEPFEVKKGSFVNVSFDLDLDSGKIKQTDLVVDQKEFIDPGDNIEMSNKSSPAKG